MLVKNDFAKATFKDVIRFKIKWILKILWELI
nr:MAG TPA: hypothetical protein [Caudoviricetes sp.]